MCEIRATSKIDDIQYNRQLYVLGESGMRMLSGSSIFLFGFGPLGVEIAKNLILTGISRLVIYDTNVVTDSDLETNFFLDRSDLQSRRSFASLVQLKDLNSSVDVSVVDWNIADGTDLTFLNGFHCVILTEAQLGLQLNVDEFCRSRNPPIKFISADVCGLFSWVFCDFGDSHRVVDADGEPVKEAFVTHITNTRPISVHLMPNSKHGFQTGDFVLFREIQGLDHLNGTSHQIRMTSLTSFEIDGVSECETEQEYRGGGICQQIKIPVHVSFEPLSKQLHKPDFVDTAVDKTETFTCHLGMITLKSFSEKFHRYPRCWCREDAKVFLQIASQVASDLKWLVTADHDILSKVSFTATGLVPALSAFLGGIVAQEALKAVTEKFLPVNQWCYFSAFDLIPDEGCFHVDFTTPGNKSNLAICVGDFLMKSLRNLNVFMVGCGAIGCEMLKNLALLHVGTESGLVSITDHDLVEKSNLSRQFLFRNNSIQKSKSSEAARIIRNFRPEMNVKAFNSKVCTETADAHFNDVFFKSQNVVVGALDNIEGRRFLDRCCVSFGRPLLDSGTMGTKGHVQVILPHITESYSSQSDPVDEDIPYCTLKSFPTRTEHTVQWAIDKFESLFNLKPSTMTKFGESCHSLRPLLQRIDDGTGDLTVTHKDLLEKLNLAIQDLLMKRPKTWIDCVTTARFKFEKYFNNKAKQLLFKFPLDLVTDEGMPFWLPPRRPPHPITFDLGNELHLDFIQAAARTYAIVYNIPVVREDWSPRNLQHILSTVTIPDFVPNAEKFVETNESVLASNTTKSNNCQISIARLKAAVEENYDGIQPQKFDKDDDSNGHVDFVCAASNLRGLMYSLQPENRNTTRRLAGKIIPAIITTTSAIAGLLSLELLRLVKQSDREKHRNSFVNLATSMFVFSEPAPVLPVKLTDSLSITLWDRWELRGHPAFTLTDFIRAVKDKYGVEVTTVLEGSRIVYMPFLPGHLKKLSQTMMDLVPPLENRSNVDLSVIVALADGDEKSGPPVTYWYI